MIAPVGFKGVVSFIAVPGMTVLTANATRQD